jgi:hypothetical protein
VGLDPQPVTQLITLNPNLTLLTTQERKKQQKEAEGKEVIFDDMNENLVMAPNSVEVQP